jgi:hypothetical protein
LYLDYRRRWAERLTDESPLFRSEYNIQKTTATAQPYPIITHAIRDFMLDLLVRSGLRKLRTEGKVRRSYIMANHGFRKFFETNAFKAGMESKEFLRMVGSTVASDKKGYGLDGDIALEATHLIQRMVGHILYDNCQHCKHILTAGNHPAASSKDTSTTTPVQSQPNRSVMKIK